MALGWGANQFEGAALPLPAETLGWERAIEVTTVPSCAELVGQGSAHTAFSLDQGQQTFLIMAKGKYFQLCRQAGLHAGDSSQTASQSMGVAVCHKTSFIMNMKRKFHLIVTSHVLFSPVLQNVMTILSLQTLQEDSLPSLSWGHFLTLFYGREGGGPSWGPGEGYKTNTLKSP